MKHLMRILNAKHISKEGKLLWEQDNILNVTHLTGELYCLGVLFSNTSKPSSYYAGLDNRAALSGADTFSNLSQEPTQFGYARQPVSSTSGFTISLNAQNVYQATTSTITFVATGGSWGP